LAKAVPDASIGDIPRLHALAEIIRGAVTYETGRTDADTKAEEAVEAGHGVCQDHAHIFIAAARLLGYPARYAGGYLMMNDRVEQEAGHAWAEIHVAGLGWVGFDVSNAISPDERYVRVATGLDYAETSPVSGMRFGAATESMDVKIQVQQQ
jgi:transglutaminase-like putative cysteine protease